MQQGDYTAISSPYFQSPQNPNPLHPPPTDHHHPTTAYASTYASAPPFATNYHPPADNYSSYPCTYTPYPQNPDPIPSLSPTAPSFSPNPDLQPSYNPPPPPSQTSSFPQFESHVPYQSQSYNPPYDQHQYTPTPSYPLPSPIPSNPNSNFNSPYTYDNESSVKFDQRVYGQSGYELSGSYLGSGRYDSGGYGGGDGYGDGVYAYHGSKVEPYGARGTWVKSSTRSSSSSLFDDFGRPISSPSGKGQPVSSTKIARAVPKADTQQDAKGGVQKYRVKLLPESGSQSTMDVLCQIGLDGIRMLDPSTSRTLRIYPLDTVTRCDVTDSSTFAFWSKSMVDIEPRCIRLQSNSYTTNTILDMVTAATIQLKEMGGRSKPSDFLKVSDQPTEKKKGLGDWMNLMKPVNEEKDHWVPDEAVTKCASCGADFSAFVRKHHCRNCGDIFCDKCTHGRIALTADENAPQVRVCDRCMAEVTHRLSNAKEAASRSTTLESHEDLAKKLQEEMERNRKASSGSKSNGSGRRMKEVACPTCTVHLQVQVPISGSETIDCGVCQHPFLVSAH